MEKAKGILLMLPFIFVLGYNLFKIPVIFVVVAILGITLFIIASLLMFIVGLIKLFE